MENRFFMEIRVPPEEVLREDTRADISLDVAFEGMIGDIEAGENYTDWEKKFDDGVTIYEFNDLGFLEFEDLADHYDAITEPKNMEIIGHLIDNPDDSIDVDWIKERADHYEDRSEYLNAITSIIDHGIIRNWAEGGYSLVGETNSMAESVLEHDYSFQEFAAAEALERLSEIPEGRFPELPYSDRSVKQRYIEEVLEEGTAGKYMIKKEVNPSLRERLF